MKRNDLCDRCQERPVELSFQGGPLYEHFRLCMDCAQEARRFKFWNDWDGWKDVEVRLAERRQSQEAS